MSWYSPSLRCMLLWGERILVRRVGQNITSGSRWAKNGTKHKRGVFGLCDLRLVGFGAAAARTGPVSGKRRGGDRPGRAESVAQGASRRPAGRRGAVGASRARHLRLSLRLARHLALVRQCLLVLADALRRAG